MENQKLNPANFDAIRYLHDYPDVAGSSYSPFDHYCEIGKQLGRTAYSKSATNTAGNPAACDDIVVSVVCITYNHEKYILDALNGFSSQITDFKFEVIIANDSSTDKTSEIIKRVRTPSFELVFIDREVNVGVKTNFVDALSRARGTYVALCEGDDYWTDPFKLQKQKDFLDSNPKDAICFHPVDVVSELGEKLYEFPKRSQKEFSLSELVKTNFIQTNSVMYRWRRDIDLANEISERSLPLDWMIHLFHAEVGSIGFINEIMGAYRKHEGGLWSSSHDLVAHRQRHGLAEISFFQDLTGHFGGYYDKYFNDIQLDLAEFLILSYIVECRPEEIKLFAISMPRLMQQVASRFGIPLPDMTTWGDLDIFQHVSSFLSVDVIVTCYNQKDTISEAIESILKQKGMLSYRLIIGDDGSTDGTQEIVDSYSKTNSNVLVVSDGTNRGMLQNLKNCISLCTAKYVAVCEGDDYWISPFKLVRQVAHLLKNKDEAMCFNWSLLDFTKDGRCVPHEEQGNLPTSKLSFDQLLQKPYTANFSSCCFRLDALQSIPSEYYDQRGAADWLLTLYVARVGNVGFIRELLSCYRIHSKGQWSGLSHVARENLMHELSSKYAKIFDRREYFTVKHDITSSLQLSELGVFANIDFTTVRYDPEVGKTCLFVSGWVVDTVHTDYKVIFSDGLQSSSVSATESRFDVFDAMVENGVFPTRTFCGFVWRMPLTRRNPIKLKISRGAVEVNWMYLHTSAVENPDV